MCLYTVVFKKMTMILLRFFVRFWAKNINVTDGMFNVCMMSSHVCCCLHTLIQVWLSFTKTYQLLCYFDNCIVYRHSSRLTCLCRNVYQEMCSSCIFEAINILLKCILSSSCKLVHSSTDEPFILPHYQQYGLQTVSLKHHFASKNRISVKYVCTFFTLVLLAIFPNNKKLCLRCYYTQSRAWHCVWHTQPPTSSSHYTALLAQDDDDTETRWNFLMHIFLKNLNVDLFLVFVSSSIFLSAYLWFFTELWAISQASSQYKKKWASLLVNKKPKQWAFRTVKLLLVLRWWMEEHMKQIFKLWYTCRYMYIMYVFYSVK